MHAWLVNVCACSPDLQSKDALPPQEFKGVQLASINMLHCLTRFMISTRRLL